MYEFVVSRNLDSSFQNLLLSLCSGESASSLLDHEHFSSDSRTRRSSADALEKIAKAPSILKKIHFQESFSSALSTASSRYQNDFTELRFLGKGGFGSVVQAKNKIDNHVYAVKKIPLRKRDNPKLLREVLALSRLHHEFVVRYFTAWIEQVDDFESFDCESEEDSFSSQESSEQSLEDWMASKTGRSSFDNSPFSLNEVHLDTLSTGDSFLDKNQETPDNTMRVLFIQMEFCEQRSLRDVIDEGIDLDQSWIFFRQILEGMAYIHSRLIKSNRKEGMIHRDLKPGNLFIANGVVKIGDFGLATVKTDVQKLVSASGNHSFQDSSLTSDIGTPVYCAPEILLTGKYTNAVDMFSIGIVFFEMVYTFKVEEV